MSAPWDEDPGWSDSTPVSETPSGVVYGTPGDGKVPTWNATTHRLEWATPSGGSSAGSAGVTYFVAADAGNGESVPTATNQNLTWTEADGQSTHLLDLTDPTEPTFVDAGEYIVNVTVVPDAAPTNEVQFNVHLHPGASSTQNYGRVAAGSGQPGSVAVSNHAEAGNELFCNLRHTEGADAIFYMSATVHRIR